jgi:regulator of nucleoside diphosphate kinase
MAPEFIAFIQLALYLLASLAVLFLGGRLVRYDLRRSETEDGKPLRRRSRLIDDLRPLQDTVVEFIAHSEYAPQILGALARKDVPLSLKSIAQKIRLASKRSHKSDLLLAVGLAVIGLMRVAGLIRLGRRGIVLTDIGREIEQRIRGNSALNSIDEANPRSHPIQFASHGFSRPLAFGSSAKSHLRMVRQALDDGPALHSVRRSRGQAASDIGALRSAPQIVPINNLSELTRNDDVKEELKHMKKNRLIMTAADHTELSVAIAAAGKLSTRGQGEMKALQDELSRAEILDAGELPADIVTMNSRAELLDLETGERMEFTLVLPVDADIEAGKISVLAPLGTAMLGYRVGDEFEWVVPYGLRRLRVIAVRFQPEASLAIAA